MSDFVFEIREAVSSDYEFLPDVENDAGEVFRDFGLPQLADDEPISVEYYRGLEVGEHALYVAVVDGLIVGFVLALVVDGGAYIREVSVRRDFSGQGIGRSLIGRVLDWARDRQDAFVCLTTFAEIPFNAPFYKKLGFEVFAPDGDMPELRDILEKEHSWCPKGNSRVAMRLCLEF